VTPHIRTWPFLIGGPGDGKPLPREHDGGIVVYPNKDDAPVLYREAVVCPTTQVRILCFVVERQWRKHEDSFPDSFPAPNAVDLAYRAMARYALERLP
jgi:hypothetical protein